MNLEINHYKKVNTIKNAFNKEYPFLKIEFFKTKHDVSEPSPGSEMIHRNISLGQINGVIREGILPLDATFTVERLEQTFRKKFGLAVQVFRRRNDVWIETTKTDQLTLGEQNEMGRDASEPIAYEKAGDRYLEDGQY